MLRRSETLDAVIELNHLYLQFVQRRLNENSEAAQRLLGMPAEVADLLERLTDAQVLKLARSAVLLCRFKWSDHDLLSRATGAELSASGANPH